MQEPEGLPPLEAVVHLPIVRIRDLDTYKAVGMRPAPSGRLTAMASGATTFWAR